MPNESRRDNTNLGEESLRSRASNIGSTAASAAHNLGNQAQDLGSKTADYANTLGDKASNFAQQVGSTFEDARVKFNDAKDVVVDRTKTAAKATDDYVVNNPWKAVGIASGIALVLGFMLRRR